jgi:fluoroquinolone resistance protein
MSAQITESKEYFAIHFVGIDMSMQTITGKEFEGCEFKGCNFNQATLAKCSFFDCHFIECNLSLIKIESSKFRDVVLQECKAVGVNWTRAAWPRLLLASPLKFYKCILNDSSFFGLNLQEAVIEDCKARDVDFREANLTDAKLSYTDFSNSLFGRTNLTGADFTEAINYDIDIFNNEIKKAKFSRHEAMRLLNSLEIELVD